MGLQTRLDLYRTIEQQRGRPMIVYVTSQRSGVPANMAQDVIPEFIDQLQKLPEDSDKLDILIESHGGDPLVSWRLMSLIREKIRKISILIPYSAFSAATLLALGADEIIMGKYGCLGPIDPQMSARKKDGSSQQFAYQDIVAFLDFIKNEAGSGQNHLEQAFRSLCEQVEPSTLGMAMRASSLSVTIAEKLLQMHMTSAEDKAKAGIIAKQLNESFFSHGHALGRNEAKAIGLQVVEATPACEELFWKVHKDIEDELKFRQPYNPLGCFLADPQSAPYLKSPPLLSLPPNVPMQAIMPIVQAHVDNQLKSAVPELKIELIHALVESSRYASAFTTENHILVSRTPDLQFRVSSIGTKQGWNNRPL